MSPDAPTSKCSQCGKSFPATVRICPDDGTVLEHDTQTSQLGKVLDGKYRLDSFLSQGGMGGVYKATHVMLGKTVAVKLINPELVTSPEVVRRFQREARAATALNHPNIVAVFDLGQTPEGTLYIAMEFVNGPSLKAAINAGGPMAPARTVTLMRQIGSALAVAHKNKIIHRDLKPQNIMLAHTEDGQEIAKLVDFGIAKTFDEATQLTMAGDAIGTPHYMAPEQAAGQAVDARSDLYSAGIILYEMLSGEVPFNDTSAPAILIKHLQETPMPPSAKNPRASVPPELEAIALKCLEKSPAARFQTADELCAALERAAASIPGAASGKDAMQSQATMPIAAAASPMWGAATVPIAAAPSTAPAPAVPAATARIPSQPAPVAPAANTAGRAVGDTRPTAIPSVQQPPAAPAVTAGAAKSSSSKSLLFVAAVIVVMLGVAGFMYMQQQRATQPTTTADNQTAPVATPAGAPPPAASQAGDGPSAAGGGSPAPSVAAPAAVPAPAVDRGAAGPPPSADRLAPASVAALPASASGVSSTQAPRAPAPVAAAAPTAAIVAPQAAATFPANPAVFFECTGPQEICSPLRSAVTDALDKAKLAVVRSVERADVHVAATAALVQETGRRLAGTDFSVKNYSIDLDGEAPKIDENVSMPGQATLSFDPTYGAQRAVEKSRLVASDIVQKIQAFAARKK